MMMHLPPFVACEGFWAFSTSAIINSNALATFSLCLAEASVQAQFHCWVRDFPSSAVTCLWMCRSDLFPTTTMGTQSAPYSIIRNQHLVTNHRSWRYWDTVAEQENIHPVQIYSPHWVAGRPGLMRSDQSANCIFAGGVYFLVPRLYG